MDSRRIAITAGSVEVTAELDDTLTADAVWEALPFEAAASTWGDEIYFGIPVSAEEEPGSSAVVEMGGGCVLAARLRRYACSLGALPRAGGPRSARPAR